MTSDDTRSLIRTVLLRYLTENAVDGRLPESGIRPETRYLDIGVLNSMGLITFIEFAEQCFHVRFSAEDLQSYEFQTPEGLAVLIEGLGGSISNG